jgi:uncharacterized protein YjbJ (UPF0337 family)
MKKELFKGKWNQLKGKVKEKWGKLTDDELTEINGKTDQLIGKLQAKYGYTDQEAIKELEEFERSLAQERADKSAGKVHKAHFQPEKQDFVDEEEEGSDFDKRKGAR